MEGVEIPFSSFKIKSKQQWQQESEKALNHQNHHSVEQLWVGYLSCYLHPKNHRGHIEYIIKDNKATSLKQCRFQAGML